eukprot:466872_1
MSSFSLFAVIATIISLQSTCNGECGRFHEEPLDICTKNIQINKLQKHYYVWGKTTYNAPGNNMWLTLYNTENECDHEDNTFYAKTWRTCLPEEGGCVYASGEMCDYDYAKAICPSTNDYDDEFIQTIVVLNECIRIEPLDNNTLPFEAQITCAGRSVDELTFELCGDSIGDPLPINDTSTLFNINDALAVGYGWECFGTLITKQPSSSPSLIIASTENGSNYAQITHVVTHFLMIFSIFLF